MGSRPDALFMLLSDEYLAFQTVCGSLLRRVQMVYDLTEIDSWEAASVELRPASQGYRLQ